MRHRVFWPLLLSLPLGLTAAAAGTAAAFPAIHHLAIGLWNAPERLPSLPENDRIHFERGSENYAREVSALLPAAIARIEAAQGRPFAHPVTIGVYTTPEAYAAANCLGSTQPVGVTPLGRVILSPVLGREQRQRLPAILTHELSHAHLQGWISFYAWVRLPTWFKEGLAVMVSDGGGAEYVGESEARAAIARGEHIEIDDSGSFSNLSDIRFERPPAHATVSHRIVMAYRQAGMFVSYLHDSDTDGFDRMMKAILSGRPFPEAVDAGYHRDVHALWQQFAAGA